MQNRESQLRLEVLLRDALVAADPEAVLRDAPAEWREALEHVDVDGLRMAALLVARLRFERLVQGSRRAAEWFESDGAACTEAFRRYHREVRPSASDPWGEAAAFEAWLAG